MDEEKKEPFLFSLAVVFALSLAVFALFCGGDFMKMGWCKVVSSIGIVAAIFIGLYFLLIFIPNYDKPKICPNAIYENSELIVYDNSDYKHNDYDSELEKIVFVNARQKLEKAAFWGYSKLKHIELPAELKEIPDYAFAGCVALESISIPNSVKSIGEYAFFGCKNLKKIDLSETKISKIKKAAFEGCKNLETAKLSSNLKKIEKNTFKNCENLKQVDISEFVEKIEEYSFFGCKNLKSVILPINLSEISDFAFCGCAFKIIKLHSSVTKTRKNSFKNCKKLTTVVFEVPKNEKFEVLPITLKNLLLSETSIKEIKLKTEKEELKDKLQEKLNKEFHNRKKIIVSNL